MTVTLYTRNGPAPRDENVVRSTTNTVDVMAPAAEQPSAPDYNQLMLDPREDGGLTTHTQASHVIPSEKYSPSIGNSSEDLFTIVNSRISSAGTAAAREMAGEYGHGTMQVVEGIEPTIVDGQQFDNVYFKANVGVIQGPAGDNGMLSHANDPSVVDYVEQTRLRKAAQAAQGNIYQQYMDGFNS